MHHGAKYLPEHNGVCIDNKVVITPKWYRRALQYAAWESDGEIVHYSLKIRNPRRHDIRMR